MNDTILSIYIFLMGALLGSFANVVILRLPKGESIAFPSSHCYSCKKKIKWYHNIPIFAWLLLRGKCASCKAPFSIRYMIVELIMALLFFGVYKAVGFNWLLLEYLIFTFALVTASVIDLDHMILPDVFTLSGIVLGLLGALVNPESGRTFVESALGVFFGGGFLWALAYFYFVFRKKEGMGGGDIKLLAWIGAILGWKALPVVILLSSISGSIVGLILAARQKGGMTYAIPFGPYLSGSALIYILFHGENWTNWYLCLHGFCD